MQGDYDQPPHNVEPVKEAAALHRLARLKGKIWALTLDEAEKYYELAEFTNPVGPQEREELTKIRMHLERRIDKLTRREVFQKAEAQQKLKLQLLDKELERARTSMNCMTHNNSKLDRVSSSITLRELDNILGPLHNYPLQNLPTEMVNHSLSMDQRPESEQSAPSAPPTLVEDEASYQNLYHNIAELVSTENTDDDILDLDEEQEEEILPVQKVEKRLTPRRKVYRRFLQAVKWVFEKIVEAKRFVWD